MKIPKFEGRQLLWIGIAFLAIVFASQIYLMYHEKQMQQTVREGVSVMAWYRSAILHHEIKVEKDGMPLPSESVHYWIVLQGVSSDGKTRNRQVEVDRATWSVARTGGRIILTKP